MRKSVFLTFAALAVLVFTGCTKKLQPLSSDNFSVAPRPVAVVGEQVPSTVTLNIPPKYFVKNAVLTVSPVLAYGSQEIAAEPVTIQGEKVRDNNRTIYYDQGGTVTIPANFPFPADLAANPDDAQMWAHLLVQQGSKTYVLPNVLLANGLNTTAALVSPKEITPSIAPDKFQRVINEKYTADINFLVNQTNIRASELQQADVKDLQQTLRDANADARQEIDEINISSYASPEGGVKVNTRIAEGREKSTQQYLDKELAKSGIDAQNLTADFTAQDWEGFQELVSKSNIQDKELILSVLSMYKDPERREREIRNLSSIFDQLAREVLPQLRRSRLTASINTIGKSDEEMAEIYKTNPAALSADELLYYANILPTTEQKAEAYSAFTRAYPNDYRGYNNLASCLLQQGDERQAQQMLDKALKINPQCSEAKMNKGVIALRNNDMTTAQSLLGNAAGAAGLGDALGVYYLKNGDYQAAVRAFADSKTNNAALAQILNKDYNTALNTLNAVTAPNELTTMLKAVIGARTGNDNMVTENINRLPQAWREMARKNQEFDGFNF